MFRFRGFDSRRRLRVSDGTDNRTTAYLAGAIGRLAGELVDELAIAICSAPIRWMEIPPYVVAG